jgi:hypothetical protein
LVKSPVNVGPYLGCYNAINTAFETNEFVVFSEDDIVFAKDAILYYNAYRDGILPHESSCIGITTSSDYYYSEINIYKQNHDVHQILDEYVPIITSIKQDAINNNYIDMVYKHNWAPNKQMGLFKSGWDTIKYYRNEYVRTFECQSISPDHKTGLFVQQNNFYFYCPVVPRSNDVGFYNTLGCTTIYAPQAQLNESPTIKFLSSDDFPLSTMKLIIGTPSTNTIIRK